MAAVAAILALSVPFNSKLVQTNENNAIVKFLADPKELDIVSLGTSHSKSAYDFEDLGLSHLSLASSSQNFHYDYELLKEYSRYMKKDAAVIISISHIGFYTNYLSETLTKFYDILDLRDYPNFDLLSYYRYKCLPATIKGYFKSLASRKLNAIGNIFIDKSASSYAAPNPVQCRNRFDSKSSHNSEQKLNDGLPERNLAILNEIISFCRAKGFKPIMIMEPLYYEYVDYITLELEYKWVGQYLDRLEDKEILFLNYSRDERFIYRKELFSDSDHLNAEGRKEFSGFVFDVLADNGYLQEGL
jgi:hypothetical protein